MKPSPTAEETRTRIVEADQQLFQRYGYSKTTVADIARVCCMSHANVYRFFPSKSAINEAICDAAISELEGGLRRIAATDLAAPERLGQLIELIACFIGETYSKNRKVYEMFTAAVWGTVQRHVCAVRAIFTDVIASGIKAGEFKQQDAGQVARCVCLAVASYWHPVAAGQCRDDPDTPSPGQMTAFLLEALGRGQEGNKHVLAERAEWR